MSQRANQQEDVEDVILEVLESGVVRATAEIIKSVKSRITLVAADMIRATKRPNEAKIDQIIANALQAGRRLCRESLIERVGRGEFRITNGGRDYLAARRAAVNAMSETLAELLGTAELD